MRATIEGKEYSIEFQYTKVADGKRARDRTYCIIRDHSTVSPGDGKTAPAVVYAFATRHPLDRNNKETSRKLALSRAIATFFDKSGRRALWEAYLGRKIELAKRIAAKTARQQQANQGAGSR